MTAAPSPFVGMARPAPQDFPSGTYSLGHGLCATVEDSATGIDQQLGGQRQMRDQQAAGGQLPVLELPWAIREPDRA